MDKKQWRQILYKKRVHIEGKKSKTEEINYSLNSFIEERKINTIAFYYPIKEEINLLPLARLMLKHNKKILFPKIIEDDLKFATVTCFNSDFKKGRYNILEPQGEVFKQKIDLIIVPGLGYNHKKYRIGYGKGYYDRYLSKKQHTYSIGCFYSDLEVDFIEDKWDIMLEYIVTEKGFL